MPTPNAQREMEKLNTTRLRRNQAPFPIGIGIHCGPNIGSADRVRYTAIGDIVNVASRLCSKAGPSQVIVSDHLRAALPDFPGFDSLGEVEMKGRANKMNIFSARWSEGLHAN